MMRIDPSTPALFRDDHTGFMDTVVEWLRGLGKAQAEPAAVTAAA